MLRGALPGTPAARGDAVPGRLPWERRGGLDTRLLVAAQAPEARRGGTRPVPELAAGGAALRGIEVDPARGWLRGRRHLRVPRRPGRDGVVPGGQHAAPGGASGPAQPDSL